MTQTPLHQLAMRLTLHGPYRLFRPGFRARFSAWMSEQIPFLLALLLMVGLIAFFTALFT